MAPANTTLTQVTSLDLSAALGHHGEMLVFADGEIDLSTAPALLSFLCGAMRHLSCRTMIVNLLQVQFLVADHSAVLRPLQVTATIDELTLFPTVTAARASA